MKLYALDEGSVVFPKVPMIRVEGPLPVVQLFETTLLTLVNYASLVCTNAARFRFAVGDKGKLLEFGKECLLSLILLFSSSFGGRGCTDSWLDPLSFARFAARAGP